MLKETIIYDFLDFLRWNSIQIRAFSIIPQLLLGEFSHNFNEKYLERRSKRWVIKILGICSWLVFIDCIFIPCTLRFIYTLHFRQYTVNTKKAYTGMFKGAVYAPSMAFASPGIVWRNIPLKKEAKGSCLCASSCKGTLILCTTRLYKPEWTQILRKLQMYACQLRSGKCKRGYVYKIHF